MTYRTPIRRGDRVALAPHLDLWVAGLRFGTVDETMRNEEGVLSYLVALHETLSVWLTLDDLLGAVG